jgi:hypothetical protein
MKVAEDRTLQRKQEKFSPHKEGTALFEKEKKKPRFSRFSGDIEEHLRVNW